MCCFSQVLVRVGSNHEHTGGWPDPCDLLRGGQPVNVFHPDVHQDPSGPMFFVQCESVPAVAAFAKGICEVAYHSLDKPAHRAVVFNDQNRHDVYCRFSPPGCSFRPETARVVVLKLDEYMYSFAFGSFSRPRQRISDLWVRAKRNNTSLPCRLSRLQICER